LNSTSRYSTFLNSWTIMKRKRTGTYEVTSVAGERVRAFVPAPLPPTPRIVFEKELQRALERATLALGRLDGASTLLPDRALVLDSYVRKEAVLSSQIEGTQSSLSDLLLFELDEAPGVPLDDVTEVSNYVAALEHGVARAREGFPLSSRLLREIHAVLLSRGRGSAKQPGEFRRSQNWIGGSRPGNAKFVPPPHTAIADVMSDLERFLHAQDDGLPLLARAGIAHVQFETIHPFLDGNGRGGERPCFVRAVPRRSSAHRATRAPLRVRDPGPRGAEGEAHLVTARNPSSDRPFIPGRRVGGGAPRFDEHRP
jgi:hypothetical protein